MKIIQEFIADVKNGENIDVYLTVLVCTVIVVLDLVGIVQPSIVTAAILLTLVCFHSVRFLREKHLVNFVTPSSV